MSNYNLHYNSNLPIQYIYYENQERNSNNISSNNSVSNNNSEEKNTDIETKINEIMTSFSEEKINTKEALNLVGNLDSVSNIKQRTDGNKTTISYVFNGTEHSWSSNDKTNVNNVETAYDISTDSSNLNKTGAAARAKKQQEKENNYASMLELLKFYTKGEINMTVTEFKSKLNNAGINFEEVVQNGKHEIVFFIDEKYYSFTFNSSSSQKEYVSNEELKKQLSILRGGRYESVEGIMNAIDNNEKISVRYTGYNTTPSGKYYYYMVSSDELGWVRVATQPKEDTELSEAKQILFEISGKVFNSLDELMEKINGNPYLTVSIRDAKSKNMTHYRVGSSETGYVSTTVLHEQQKDYTQTVRHFQRIAMGMGYMD